MEFGLNDVVCPAGGLCVAVGQTPTLEGAAASFAPGSGAPAATSESVTPTSGTFGQPISATVTRSSPVGTPGGRVYFVDGVFADYPQRLDESGQTVFTMRDLAPGSHTLTAAYVGPSGSVLGRWDVPTNRARSTAANVDVTCATTISGELPKNLVVSNSGVCRLRRPRLRLRQCPHRRVVVGCIVDDHGFDHRERGEWAADVCEHDRQSAKVTSATGYVLVGDRGPGENFELAAQQTPSVEREAVSESDGATAVGNSVGSMTTSVRARRYPFELAPRLAPNTLLPAARAHSWPVGRTARTDRRSKDRMQRQGAARSTTTPTSRSSPAASPRRPRGHRDGRPVGEFSVLGSLRHPNKG